MKRKQLIVAAALVVLVATVVAVYRMVEHARRDLVTLDVIDAPLADVLAWISRQTREKIVADQKLNGPVTLHVRRAPLREVLGQVADQIGALARLNFAVASSKSKFAGLESVLRQGGDFARGGWTNMSSLPEPDEEGPAGAKVMRLDRPFPPPASAAELSPSPGPRVGVRIVRGGSENGGSSRVEIRSGGGATKQTAQTTVTATGDDGVTHTFDLSPERLLLETTLAARVSAGTPSAASAEEADRLARLVGGKTARLYSIEAVPLPLGELPPGLNEFSGHSGERLDSDGPLAPDSMEASAKRHRFDQLTRLTPEQRARSAGGRQGPVLNQNVDIDEKR